MAAGTGKAASLPLAGIRVLDLTRILAGPFTTQSLGDLGAEVIKIERPGAGDESRAFGPPYLTDADGQPTRDNAFYLCANRNKKSVAVNIAKPEGQAIIRELAKISDVLVENFKVGDLARYGLDYESLHQLNPRLIYCSITGYGQDGPYADRPGYDAIFQAGAGLMGVTGLPDDAPGGGPMKVGPSISDILAAHNLTSATLAALYHRDAHGGGNGEGGGQHIDIALFDAVVASLSHYAQIYLVSGDIPPRRGAQGNGGIPADTFTCADGKAIMIVAGNDTQYRHLCEVAGRADLITDPRFRTNLDRIRNRDEVSALWREIFVQQPQAWWLDALYKAGVPSGPINNLAEVFAEPHAQHRGLAVKVDHPLRADLPLIRSPMHFSETPIETYAPPPRLGEHTGEVLRGLLGYGAEQIAALREGGIIQDGESK